jgi:hypothetical protein
MRINEGRETFHKDLAWAIALLTKTFADLEQEADRLSSTGQVSHAAGRAAMHPSSWYTTQRTAGSTLRRGHRYHEQAIHLLKSNEFQSIWQGQDWLDLHLVRAFLFQKALYPHASIFQ